MSIRRADARVVVLCHAAYRRRDLRTSAIHYLARIWREAGVEVVFAFGTRAVPDADLVLFHVDLSVVPARYVRLAERFPIALNRRILDVRKATISTNLVARGEVCDGPVIVKTNLNAAGRPERLATPGFLRTLRRLARSAGWRSLGGVNRLEAYRVFEDAADVPAAVWRDRRFVVERFRPQRTEDGGYALHSAFVLGGPRVCERIESPHPIVCDGTSVQARNVQPESSLKARCAALRLDYGKIDYTLNGGACVVLDVNKTVGAAVSGTNPQQDAKRRMWAAGLYEYLDGRRTPA